MREWIDEYEQDPIKKGKERCHYLHNITGVSERAIWEWGYLQTVSTSFVFLQVGQKEIGEDVYKRQNIWNAHNQQFF